MKQMNYVKYKDGKTQKLLGYSVSSDIVSLRYTKDEIPYINETEGFCLYDQNNNLIANCQDFIYRYDVLNAENTTQPYTVAYTNNPELKQTVPYPTQEQMDADAESIPVEPLTNEELTEMVGGLLYETSLMQMQIGLFSTEEVI